MAKISSERLERYRKLADIPSMEMSNLAARSIYQRMLDEGANVNDMQDPGVGMYMAPYKKDVNELDIACVGIPMENSIPLRTSTKDGPAALRKWSQWLGPVHEIWGTIPFDLFSVADYGDMVFEQQDILSRIEQIYTLFDQF